MLIFVMLPEGTPALFILQCCQYYSKHITTLYIAADGERCIESMQPHFWLFNMTSKFLFYTSLMCSHVPLRFSWKILPSFTVCVFRRVLSRGVQAVALLVMMPVFTFMGIKVSVLAGHLRGEAIDWDFASVCIKFWKVIALKKLHGIMFGVMMRKRGVSSQCANSSTHKLQPRMKLQNCWEFKWCHGALWGRLPRWISLETSIFFPYDWPSHNWWMGYFISHEQSIIGWLILRSTELFTVNLAGKTIHLIVHTVSYSLFVFFLCVCVCNISMHLS